MTTATGIDADLAWHLGDPLREQRRMASGAAVVDRSNRGVLQVPGQDRLSWLHSICSQHLTKLSDGDSTEALVLSPNGHVEQHWQLTELDDTVWLDVEPGTADAALGYLTKMRFMKRVEPADVSADWAVLSVLGPAVAQALTDAGLPTPDRSAVPLPGGGFVRSAALGALPGVDLLVPRADMDTILARLSAAGADAAGLWAYEAHRVAARLPRLAHETDHRTIPHEVGWIGTAVHLDKGCYRGQETVARVQNLGRPPRRLVLVHLSGETDELPPPGTPITLAGADGADGTARPIGFLGTAVHHYEDGPIALAVVKRQISDDADLYVGAFRARIDAV